MTEFLLIAAGFIAGVAAILAALWWVSKDTDNLPAPLELEHQHSRKPRGMLAWLRAG